MSRNRFIKHRYTLEELRSLPTLLVGQSDDLKVETENVRIWLSRCTVADGEPYNNKVTVEQYSPNAGRLGRWEEVETYQAL